jgi:Zn-finger nucleic acid-binding protein
MNCPKCNGALKARTREDIEIDVCSECGGVWLDSGELEKIIASEREHLGISEQQNWRMYDRGREGYDPTPAPAQSKGYLESLIKDD